MREEKASKSKENKGKLCFRQLKQNATEGVRVHGDAEKLAQWQRGNDRTGQEKEWGHVILLCPLLAS